MPDYLVSKLVLPGSSTQYNIKDRVSGYQTSSDVTTLIAQAIGDIHSFEVQIVNSLPVSDIDTHTIYFLPNQSNTYDEYMYINNTWELIGNTSIDLSNYVQKTDIATEQTAGLMSAQDKIDLDRLKLDESTPITLTDITSFTVTDAYAKAVDVFDMSFDPQVEIHTGRNLLNRATEIKGYYIGANGVMTAQEGDEYSDLIPVSQGDKIYVYGIHNEARNGNKRLHGYDASGNWKQQLAYVSIPATVVPPSAYQLPVANVPSGVSYVRFSHRTADTDIMIEKGEKTHYEPYGETKLLIPYSSGLRLTFNNEVHLITLGNDFYVGELDVLTGKQKITWGHIASYNGELLPGEWISTLDEYAPGTYPTIGAEVIYELATPTVITTTAVPLSTVKGTNSGSVNQGIISEFTYEAGSTIIQSLVVEGGVIKLGNTSISESQLIQLLQLIS